MASSHANSNANIYDPPVLPQRAFEADYPDGARADATGRLTHDIDGRPLTARYVVGRKVVGGKDEALPPAQHDNLSEALFGNRIERVKAREIGGDAGRFKISHDVDGSTIYQPYVSESIEAKKAPLVAAHEISHGIDYFSAGRVGVPTEGLLRNELQPIYNDLNNGNRNRAASGGAAPWAKPERPEHFGYKGEDIGREYMAEAIRAYMADPNYIKTVAPKTAARIRQYVNENPRLSDTIQFNANGSKGGAAVGLGVVEGGLPIPQDHRGNALSSYVY